jgi:general stress protein 26
MTDDRLTADEIWSKLEDQHVCMLVEQAGSGPQPMRARPMAPLARKAEGVVWFVAARDSGNGDALADDGAVLLLFQDTRANFYAAIEGAAAIVEDPAKVHELWSPAMSSFFDGPDDAGIILIAVTPHACEYWAGPGQVVAGIKMLFGAATGVKADLGTQGRVRL